MLTYRENFGLSWKQMAETPLSVFFRDTEMMQIRNDINQEGNQATGVKK